MAAPVFAPTASAPSGVLLLELDLADLAPALVDRFGGPQPVEYLLTDADHKLVASRSVDPGQWDGKDISATPLAQAGDPHGARLTGVDGQPRIYGSAVVDDTRGKKDVNGLKWHVYAGIPVGAAEAQARASRDDLETAGAIVLPLLMLVTLSGILAVKRR